MPWIYGIKVSEADYAELLRRLRDRGTAKPAFAANTVEQVAKRDATIETALDDREAILTELRDWQGLDEASPELAAVRDWLARPPGRARAV